MQQLPASLPDECPDTLPAWRGGLFPTAKERGASPREFPAATRPLITAEQLEAHLLTPHAWRSLPDGRPLRLQAGGMEFLIDDFGGYHANELRSAHRLLYFATRSEAEMRALWVPAVPRGEEPEPEPMALHIRALQAEISAWASATFAPDAALQVRRLAFELWSAVIERLPVSAEKKSPAPEESPAASASPTSSISATPSLEATPSGRSSSSSAPISSPSASHGSVGVMPPATP